MKRKLKLLTVILLFLLSAGLAAYLYVENIKDFSLETDQIVLACVFGLLGIFINFFLHSLFHETGHVIFGKLSGFKLYKFSVGFISIVKTKKFFKFEFALSKYGGATFMVCRENKNLYRRYALYVFGGLLGSFLCLIAYLLTAVLLKYSNLNLLYLYTALISGFPLSVYFLSLNSMPFSAGGVSTDGATLRGIIKKDRETQVLINVLNIQSLLMAGFSPSEIDKDYFFNIPVVADNNINKIVLFSYRYAYSLDLLDFVSAADTMRALERMQRYIPDIYKENLLTDMFFNAAFNNDIEKAKELYSKIEKTINSETDINNLRIKMAYELYILKDYKKAITTGFFALKLKDSYFISGIAKMEEKLINYMIGAAEKPVDTDCV
jgi:hypothetical protein